MILPTKEQALGYFDEFVVPRNIVDHCKAVQKYSNFFAKELVKVGVEIDLELVDRLSLLHDLFKAVTIDLSKVDPIHQYVANEQELAKWRELKEKYAGMHESEIGFDFFKDDFSEFAKALKNTSDPISKKSIEELIVHYVDWRMLKDELVDLDVRLKYLFDRYPDYKHVYEESVKLVKNDEKKLFSKLSFDPEDLKKECGNDDLVVGDEL